MRRRLAVLTLALALVGCSTLDPDEEALSPSAAASPSSLGAVCAGSNDECVELGVLDPGPDAGDEERRIQFAQEAFWTHVNEQGGIRGHPVVLHRGAEIDGDELAYLGSSLLTAPQLDDLPPRTFVAGTVPLTSNWPFEPRVLQTGGSSCVQAMNAVDVLAYRGAAIDSLAVVHLDDAQGMDAAAGVQLAAERRGVPLTSLSVTAGPGHDDVVATIRAEEPDVVVLALSPIETGVIVAGLVADGFEGEFATTSRGWQRSMAEGPYADVLAERLLIAASWREFTLPTVGHGAMRAALGNVREDEGYTAGWIGNYPLLELLEAAEGSEALTRSGLARAAAGLDDVDYEGMLPPLIGTPFSGTPREQVAVRTAFAVPDLDARSRTFAVEDYFNGVTVAAYPFRRPCTAA